MRENEFQGRLIRKLRTMFPGAIVLKNDSGYQQGIPDLTILWRDKWALLEVKPKKPTSPDDFEPNQEWFLAHADEMCFGACIYPENEKDVLRDLQQALQPSGAARLPLR